MKKLHLSNREKIIAGVCGGLHESCGIDVSIIRIIFGISLFFGGTGFLVYIALALILPRDFSGEYSLENNSIKSNSYLFYRSWNDRMIAGVCGGISNKMNIDVSIIRLIFVILLITGGIGFPLYLVLWFIFPLEEK